MGDLTELEVMFTMRPKPLAAMPSTVALISSMGVSMLASRALIQASREAWIKALDANMLTPIELIKATVDGMAARGFGRIVNITSSSVKSPIDILGLSNGARSGLTGFVAGVARTKIAAQGVTINNILPGKFDTDRIRANVEVTAQKMGKSVAEVRALQQSQVPAGRYGTPQEFGSLCAYICSQQASYITGQNFLTDGGAYPGTY